MTFSDRGGLQRRAPARTQYEAAPEALRTLLLELMQERWGNQQSYKALCRVHQTIPATGVVGEATAYGPFVDLLMKLEWFEVFDLLEQVRPPGLADDIVNERFVSCGLAYEMKAGRIDLYDPEGESLGLSGNENDAEALLTDRFDAVKFQYQRALTALHGRPADLEKAVSESFNALEAVARVLTGKKDFGAAIDKALAGRTGLGALGDSLKKMYGYASQVPGARHGRHAEPDLTFAEAKVVVRTAGAAIAYLIETASL